MKIYIYMTKIFLKHIRVPEKIDHIFLPPIYTQKWLA